MARVKIGNVRTPIEYLKQFFAPAGYGLGTVGGESEWNGDANTLTNQGWYRLETGTTNGVGASASLRVDGYTTTGLTQTAYTRTGFIMQRTCKDGTWGEWEWENPPMFPGVEYRTTERWQDKPVYYKVVDFGGLPNATTATVPIGAENIRWAFLDLSKSWAGPASDLATNYLPNCANITETVIRDGKISITTNTSMTGTLAYIAAKYTKTTD